MDRIIQLVQAVHSEASAMAWLGLGILLPLCIGMGAVALLWIRGGGLRRRKVG